MNDIHPDALLTAAPDGYWFKIVDFLQQNWALADVASDTTVVWFIDDASGVFDRMDFPTAEAALAGLTRNGFRPFADDPEAARFIVPPRPPFRAPVHPRGRIYSEGTFWRS